MDSLKFVIVGDKGVGKLSLIFTYLDGAFPGEYMPTMYDANDINNIVDGKMVKFRLWYTNAEEEYNRLRPLSYPMTDIFILCYSVEKPASLENVKTKWLPEVRDHCPMVPVYIVACKIDLRDSKDLKVISEKEGQKMAKELGVEYLETSAMKNKGVKEGIEFAVRLYRREGYRGCRCKRPWCSLHHEKRESKEPGGCIIE